MLALSSLAIAVAPLAMPAGYSWVSNAIIESAVQAQPNAWVGRAGFLLLGFAVPMGMVNLPALAGALQRAMFPVAYVWFALEAVRLSRAPAVPVRTEPAGAAVENLPTRDGG